MASEFRVELSSSLLANTVVFIRGFVPWDSKRFTVNFETTVFSRAENDIAFHFDTRFDQGAVVRNTKLNGQWGQEEIEVPDDTPALPICKGQPFELAIFVEDTKFKVAVNGMHFINYSHRLYYKLIQLITIKGTVFIDHVTYNAQTMNEMQSLITLLEITNPQVPLNLEIPGGLMDGKQIYIMGKPSKYASRFDIQLTSPDNEVLFHLTAAFSDYNPNESYMIASNCKGQDPRLAERTPFVRNHIVDISITSQDGGHHVTVNAIPCTYVRRPHYTLAKGTWAHRLQIIGNLHVFFVSVTQNAHASRTYYCNTAITTCD